VVPILRANEQCHLPAVMTWYCPIEPRLGSSPASGVGLCASVAAARRIDRRQLVQDRSPMGWIQHSMGWVSDSRAPGWRRKKDEAAGRAAPRGLRSAKPSSALMTILGCSRYSATFCIAKRSVILRS